MKTANTAPAPATAQTTGSKWSASRRIANGSAIAGDAAARPASTGSMSRARTSRPSRGRGRRASATASATAGRRSARAISAPGMSRQSEAAASRNASPSPSAGSRRATASSGIAARTSGIRVNASIRAERSPVRPRPSRPRPDRPLRARRERPPTQPQARQDHPPRMLGRGDPAVLEEKPQVPAHLLAEERRRLAPPRGAADVHRLGLRVEERPPARRTSAVRPVRLLAEEEEVLVERPDLLECLAPDQERRRLRELDPEPRRAGIPRRKRVQQPRSGRQLPQEQVLGRDPPGRRKTANRRLEGPVRVQQPRSDPRRPRDPVREARQPVDRVSHDPRVRVEDENVRSRRLADAPVPAGREPEVLLLDDLRGGKAGPTRSTVPSVDPWSTTTVSSPETLSRACSTCGSPL